MARMRSKVGDDAMADVNVTVLGADATLADVQNAAQTMPFFLERKLIVVRNWLSAQAAPRRKKGETGTIQKLVDFLPDLSEATALVFCEDATLPETHPLIEGAEKLHGRVKRYDVPANVGRWLIERAQSKGGSLDARAAEALAARINKGNRNDRDHFDEDARLYMLKLDNELDKLVGYAGSRAISVSDVESLVGEEEAPDIFKIVDALAHRRAAEAYTATRGLIARGEHPLVVLTSIANHTRRLIQAKDNERLSETAFAQLIGAHPFVAKRALTEARGFEMVELERAHLAVADIDAAIKSGRIDDIAGLDLLIATLCAG
ncbi:MAG: hypothetical protein K1X39_07740 [Thermoflexales bacterium]|nr:hypothetical protein [Thermoflexales bacterium]